MRYFSPAVLSMIAEANLQCFYLVEMNLRGTILRHVNLPYDVTIGTSTFTADNTLIGIDAPKLSKTVDREAYKLTYSDPTFAFKPLFALGVVGSSVSVYVGFFNTTKEAIGTVAPGHPLLAEEDIVLAYKGIVDSHGYVISEDEDVVVVIECSSPMADLDLKRTLITSKDAMRGLSPTDSSFDQVYEGSKGIDLLWGKA